MARIRISPRNVTTRYLSAAASSDGRRLQQPFTPGSSIAACSWMPTPFRTTRRDPSRWTPEHVHHLALAVPIEIHHRKVDDGTEVGETLEHLYESAALLRGQGRRVQPHELTIAVRGADVHHAVIQIRQRARDGRVPERFQLERVHALTVVHEHEQMQRARRVGQEMPGAVRVHDAVRHDVGGSRVATARATTPEDPRRRRRRRRRRLSC